MDQEKIGRFLKELRKEKKITQEQLAEQLNVSVRTVSRWETGSNMPDLSVLVEIMDLYDVDIREILDGERKSEPQNGKDILKQVVEYGETEKRNLKKKLRIFAITMLIAACAAIGLMIFRGSDGQTHSEPLVLASALSGEGKRFPGGDLDPSVLEASGMDTVISDFSFQETSEKTLYRVSFRVKDHNFASTGFLIPARFNNYGKDHFLLSPVVADSDSADYKVSKILLAFHANLHDLRAPNADMNGRTVATVWITETTTGDVYEFQLQLPDETEALLTQGRLSVLWEVSDGIREAADEFFFAKEKSITVVIEGGDP